MRLAQEHTRGRDAPWIGSRFPRSAAILARPAARVSWSTVRFGRGDVQGEIRMASGFERADQLTGETWKLADLAPVRASVVAAPERDGLPRDHLEALRCAGRRVER